ncbi:sigma-70 family RNA polymerase sigma factor [Planctomycetota bacterium]
MNEEQLTNLAVQSGSGDMNAVEALMKGIYGHLCSFLRLLAVPESDLEPVAQDTAIHMYRSLTTYDTEQPFLPWLRGIARNVVKNYWREHVQEEKKLSLFKRYIKETFSKGQAVTDARKDKLEQCMDQLEGKQREIVNMRYVEGLKSDSIAEKFSMKAVTVRQALSRIRTALKSCIEAEL